MSYQQDLGATTTGWSGDKYDLIATQKAKATAGSFIIVTIGFDGSFVKAMTYPSYAAATGRWDSTYRLRLPEDTAYALLYDKTREAGWEGVENNMNTLRTVTVTAKKTNWKSAVPWILGGVAAFVVADLFLLGGLTGKKPARKRRAAKWRRRIVTTWR